MKLPRAVSPPWAALAMFGLIVLPLASVPLTAAPEPPAQTPRPSRWERLREKVVVKDAEYAGNETCALAH